ncbi:hypothetical protein KJ780_02180 [Candidatus Micrarchaeota archaeon]|nr:hypothetical protein [Candidatus Micrarchaeota archaeon]
MQKTKRIVVNIPHQSEHCIGLRFQKYLKDAAEKRHIQIVQSPVPSSSDFAWKLRKKMQETDNGLIGISPHVIQKRTQFVMELYDFLLRIRAMNSAFVRGANSTIFLELHCFMPSGQFISSKEMQFLSGDAIGIIADPLLHFKDLKKELKGDLVFSSQFLRIDIEMTVAKALGAMVGFDLLKAMFTYMDLFEKIAPLENQIVVIEACSKGFHPDSKDKMHRYYRKLKESEELTAFEKGYCCKRNYQPVFTSRDVQFFLESIIK